MSKKIITIVYTDRFSKRNIETSSLIKKLEDIGFQVKIINTLNLKKGVYYKALWRLKVFLYEILKYRFLETRKIKKQILKHKYKYQHDLIGQDKLRKYLGFPFPNSLHIFNFLNKIFMKLPSGIKEFETNFLLITNMQDYTAQSYIKYAEENELLVFPLLNSWDHLTHGGKAIKSKSIPFYMVWNEIHKKELVTLHNIDKDKIQTVGSLQYEYLINMKYDKSLNKETLLNMYDLKGNPIVVFLPAYNDRHGKYEPYIVENILKRINEFKKNIVIIMRPYPYDKSFNRRFEKVLSSKNVKVALIDEDFSTDRKNMSILLKNSDIVLSGCGTAAIEAMYYNTAVIHIAVNTSENTQIDTLEKENFFSDHYKHIMNKNASFFVQTSEELIEAIKKYIDEPKLHSKERQHVIQEQLCHDKQVSSDIIIENLKRYI